ncbi:fumarylacetoacetase [Reinekea sp.]|jgi:fumarylacetoacetase|uniref:fumarylacetoacetase n=1 Tax=Reinekea sp. TaxID=1970455 RepID=UPI003989F97E
MLNATHDPSLTSWVASANDGLTDFPIQNLPFASVKKRGGNALFSIGVAIGDQVLPLAPLAKLNLAKGLVQEALQCCQDSTMNRLMTLTPAYWSALRADLSRWLQTGSAEEAILSPLLFSQSDAQFQRPCHIGDFTDFYSSIYHATTVGKLFRPDNPLLPNYKWVPIGYHGRASSIDVSGQAFHRPKGQTKAPNATVPSFGPCKRLDYELEIGFFVGQSNVLGDSLTMETAEQRLFGICLLNDWSARDIQAWEYQPLGPFLAKSFASTISPWIVTAEALAPFRVPFTREEGEPEPMPYLDSVHNQKFGAFDIQLACAIEAKNLPRTQLSHSNFKDSYWSIAQMLTHHASNGCNLQAGDLMGSGTQSGPSLEQAGSMLELTQGGKVPIEFENGQQRIFLNDGDTIIMTGHCEAAGAVRIGFGEVRSMVLPAKA